MATGNKIETRGHIAGFKEEISKSAAIGDDEFFTWFDSARDTDAAFVRGSWDFMAHIALPAAKFLPNPEEKIALEIGHGGGRILAGASRCFKSVIGVDIHENNKKVDNELKKRGINNFRLFKTKGNDIPIEKEFVDLVYSFIVFLHVERIEVFEKYLNETYRILRPNGIAVLYFGRKYTLSLNKSLKLFYLFDKVIERFLLPKGYREIPAKVNCINLLVSLSYAKSLAKKAGFTILSELVSHKKVPDGITLYGVQNGLILKK